jgi:hypothetical protein
MYIEHSVVASEYEATHKFCKPQGTNVVKVNIKLFGQRIAKLFI